MRNHLLITYILSVPIILKLKIIDWIFWIITLIYNTLRRSINENKTKQKMYSTKQKTKKNLGSNIFNSIYLHLYLYLYLYLTVC